MNKASLAQWLQRLESVHPREMELGLERVSAVALRLNLLPVAQPVVTVAGTNGKGSTVAVLEALLQESGKCTGTFTSPHFQRFNERIRVGTQEVTDSELIAAFAAIDRAREEISLTYFEFATLAALLIFRERSPDVLILEVGLGGRLDSVNIVDPDVAVITSIDLDHQDWLGDTRAQIAIEKGGIMRPDSPVIVADTEPPEQLIEQARATGVSRLLLLGQDFGCTVSATGWNSWLWRGDGVLQQLSEQPHGALLPENISAALQASALLGVGVDDALLARALASAAPTGRRERRQLAGIDYVLDVAHNPAAVNKMLEYIDLIPCKGRTFSIFSVMADKDVKTMIEAAAEYIEGWFVADQPSNERAVQAAELAQMLRNAGQETVSMNGNLQQALRAAQCEMVAGDRLVVFGSFFTVAEVLPLLHDERPRGEAGAQQ